MSRKLASVRIIKDILPIPNADNLELAVIDGWKVVVKKDEFKINDKVIYFEIDSFLPIEEKYEFLRKSSYRNTANLGEGFRIRSIRLRKQLSQGLILPLENQNLPINYDLTYDLNIKLFEPPIPTNIAGEIKGNFPNFIPKTNQERIQNIYDEIQYSKDTFEVSTKLDGTSLTLYKYNNEFGICSRNWELKINEENKLNNSLVKLGLKYKDIIKNNIAVQGELVGPGIQGNPYKLKEIELYIFDIFDIEEQKYISSLNRLDYSLDFMHVPIIGYKQMNEFDNIDELLKFSGLYKSINDAISEGLVFKSIEHPDISFKVINNEYLIKQKD
jgi:RNA ligase (TIGR02306 family)